MQEILNILTELEQTDSDWLLETGIEKQVIANHVLIEEGEHPDSIFIVLQGLLNVFTSSLGENPIAQIGPGEVFGEISFLHQQAAMAAVVASENSLLLAIPRKELEEKLGTDTAFAARFYRALAIFNTGRLQNSVTKLAKELTVVEEKTRASLAKWDDFTGAFQAYKTMLQEVDKAAIKNQGIVPEDAKGKVIDGFRQMVLFLNEKIGDDSGLPDNVRNQLGHLAKIELLPYLFLTEIGERIYAKPRGYAGDFLTIHKMYENIPVGTGRIGPVLAECFLTQPAAMAVKNRRGLLKEEIFKVVQENEGTTTNISSLACGPAAEVFDVFDQLNDPTQLRANLLDIDLQALAFIDDRVQQKRLQRQVVPFNGNLVYLATGRQKLDVVPQDLMYSIGLIDYFNDHFVIKLLNFIHKTLKPGGKAILGNFHPKNTDKALMDYILDWQLIHRTEEDMNRLFEQSDFNRSCSEIRFEESGINLFAMCVK